MTRLLSRSTDQPSPQVPQPGEVLGDKYRIEREIGSGGMGIVYEVTHLVMTKKRFAVKWLLPLPEGYKQEDVQAALRRFTREAEIAGGICHPNVVQVFDVTLSDSGCFMVMELLEGESLEARLKRAGPLPVAEACRIVIASASGVGAAHASNVIHRDIKPANIFLTRVAGAELPSPKVLDFGISRFTSPEGSDQSTVTRAGTLIGTPMYMAPEQLRGFECDARTDVYGLGVTLYEALAGQPAYTAPTHADLVVRIVTGDVRELRQLDATIPAGLSALVMRALHHQPEQRFESVQALMAALEPYASSATRPAALVVTPRPARSRWAVWLALGVAVLGLGIVAARWALSRADEPAQLPSPPSAASAAQAPSILRPKPLQATTEAVASPPTAAEANPEEIGQAPPQALPQPVNQPANGPSPDKRAPARSADTLPAANSGRKQAPEQRPTSSPAQPPQRPAAPAPATRTPKPRPTLDGI